VHLAHAGLARLERVVALQPRGDARLRAALVVAVAAGLYSGMLSVMPPETEREVPAPADLVACSSTPSCGFWPSSTART